MSSPSNAPQPACAPWPAVPIAGLPLDSLGNYLATLGLVSMAARQWPRVRACWRDQEFCLVNGPATRQEMLTGLQAMAARGDWSRYQRAWLQAQEADTKALQKDRTARALRTIAWRASASEDCLTLLDAHVVAGARRSLNPLLGNGGSAGKRSFAKGWGEATKALLEPDVQSDLDAFLMGRPSRALSDYKGGSWFSAANKTYNTGAEKFFREGCISPWAMALACEGLRFFRGITSRRLGSRKPAAAAFPFTVEPAAPESSGELGRRLAEIWVPVWQRPMSAAEIEILFFRGRATVGARAVTSSAAFAAAVLRGGVDAGVVEFRRFTLAHTTSTNTFESELDSVIPVPAPGRKPSAGVEIAPAALRWRNRLPPDQFTRTSKTFAGLRGPIDTALARLARAPDSESITSLVDALIFALRRTDRNRSFRKAKVHFELLPGSPAALIADTVPTAEMRLGAALASLTPTRAHGTEPATGPFLSYWLGAVQQGRHWAIPEAVPARRVFSGNNFVSDAGAVARRLLLEQDTDAEPPFSAQTAVPLDDMERLLAGSLDEGEISRWAMRCSLFSRPMPPHVLAVPCPSSPLSADIAMYALLKACFDARFLIELGARRPVRSGNTSTIAAQLLAGNPVAAVAAAQRQLRGPGLAIGRIDSELAQFDPARMLAALLIPVRHHQLIPAFQRWLYPGERSKEE